MYVNAVALMPENDTSNKSDSETSSVADESDTKTDGMPLLYESSDDH